MLAALSLIDYPLQYVLWILAGSIYGLIIGVIPSIGATTGLLAVFSFISLFEHTPYLGVAFCLAVVAGSTTSDTYTSILFGVPGANSSAASIVDGYPLTLQGKPIYALTAALFTSTVNGLLWGAIVFLLLPYYTGLILYFGIPELWALTVLALVSVSLLINRYKIRSVIAIFAGLFIGSIGTDPVTAASRYTFGWFYLADGVQLIPLVAGLFAVPEMLQVLRTRMRLHQGELNYMTQTRDGIRAVWRNRWLALRGGLIGSIVGALPGLGGAVADWLAYSQAIATNSSEKFGNGNIKGVIGPEGANNAQKATSMLPTVLFGIPGAPFAVVLIGLFSYLDFELGSITLMSDDQFFFSMAVGFLSATILILPICLFLNRYLIVLVKVPIQYYAVLVLILIVWACGQYTGGWEDYVILILASALGFFCKKFNFSRPCLLLAYILSDKLESLSLQLSQLYPLWQLIQRPGFLVIVFLMGLLIYYGLFRSRGIDFA